MVTKPCASLNDLLVREVKTPTRNMQKMEQNVHPATDVVKPRFDRASLVSSSPENFEWFVPQG